MQKNKISLKHKMLIPTIILFAISILIISANNYRLLSTTVRTKTNTNLDIFTNNILVQLNHLDRSLDTVKRTLNKKNVASARAVAYILENARIDLTTEELQRLAELLDIVDLCIVGSDGILQNSNIEDFIGFDYNSAEITKKYMKLIDGTVTEIAEDPRASILESGMYTGSSHYAGVARTDDAGFIQVGFDVTAFDELREQIDIQKMIEDIELENNGYGIVLLNGVISAHPNVELTGADMAGEEWYKSVCTGSGFAWLDIDGVKYYAGYKNANGYTVVGLIPKTDYYSEINEALVNTLIFLVIASVIMVFVVYVIVNRLLRPIKNVTDGLGEIAKGNFDARIEGDYNDEFALIKEAVNDMAASIRTYLNDKLHAERIAHEAELERLDLVIKVHYDALTNVYNRRYLDENLDRIIKSLSRIGGLLSVMMIDIDFFKKFNDTYGHSNGDECLKAVARALTGVITREDDFVARYGGEEFIVVLPHTDGDGARVIADKLLDKVSTLKIRHAQSKVTDYVTISIGITTKKAIYPQKGVDYIKGADEALYMSKQNGRNQYTFVN